MTLKIIAVVNSDAADSVQVTKGKNVSVRTENKGEKSFSFDAAFVGIKTDEIFASHIANLTNNVFSGLDTSIACIGPGKGGSHQLLHGLSYNANNGIVPLFLQDLFDKINSMSNYEHLVSVSMVQIEETGSLLDLLNPHTRPMVLKQSQPLGIYIDELSSIVCTNANEACNLYSGGCKAETALKSPQRNIVFNLFISQRPRGDNSQKGISSKISFFDLAGSDSMMENTSLKTLFRSLGKGKVNKSPGSVITQLYQDAVVNSSHPVLLAYISGEESSLNVLEMAKSISGIRCNPRKRSGDIEGVVAQMRKDTKVVRDKMILQSTPQKKDVAQLENMLFDLKAVKRTGWDLRILASNHYLEERHRSLGDRGLLWVLESSKASNHEEIKELQKKVDQLSAEFRKQKRNADELKEKLKTSITQYAKQVESSKSNENDAKTLVTTIQQMKESYKRENEKTESIGGKLKEAQEQLRREREAGLDFSSFNFDMTVLKLKEDRERMKNDDQQMVKEELEKMKTAVEHEKVELELRHKSGGLAQISSEEMLQNGIALATLRAEKSVVTTQLDVFKKEISLLETHVEALAEKHKKEREIQELQNLQTFRAYRQVFEEFKVDLENRWRGLLDDAIQDAVFLNSRNNEVSQQNEQLKLDVSELKDKLSLTGTPLGKKSTVTGITEA